MKNISTGFGLCVAAAAALAYPFVSSLASSAEAGAIAAILAKEAKFVKVTPGGYGEVVWIPKGGNVQFTAVAYDSNAIPLSPQPTVVWSTSVPAVKVSSAGVVTRTGDSDARGELRATVTNPDGQKVHGSVYIGVMKDGAHLSQLLADWGNAPRQDIPLSDCPLALINP